MKNLLTATMPALALLALGGCASTGAIPSTENDSVYYSSADRAAVAAQAPASGSYQSGGYGYESARVQTQTTQTAPAAEDANPDYQGGTAQTGSTSTDYYDDSYNSTSPSGFNQPYTGPGVSTYNYTPTWSVAPAFYGSPFGYGAGLSLAYGYGGFGGYSPFGYGYGFPGYGGFYDPFYSPFGYGYGSAFSIGFGYGGFGYPYGFGSPFGYGYGGYPYGYGAYGDYYGGGGYYGGARRYVYNNAIVSGGYPNGYDRGAVHIGRRESRVSNAVSTAGMANPGTAAGSNPGPIGNRRTNGAASGFGGAVGNAPTGVVGNSPAAAGAYNSPTPTDRSRLFGNNPATPNAPGSAAGASRTDRAALRNSGMSSAPQSGYNQPRTDAAGQPQRGGFFRQMFSAPANQGGGQASGFEQRGGGAQRGFEQRGFAQPEQRSYSQPRMEQRSFSQPQPMQSPSFGGSRGGFGGGGGGGSFGGGGGGGGGRRGR